MRVVNTVVRPLISLLISLLVTSLIVFLLINMLPGDVAATILGTNSNPAAIEALRQRMGLDRPVMIRYVEWLGGIVHGDLGTSALDPTRSVASIIGNKLIVTTWLAVLAMIVTILVAVPLGLAAALRRRHADGAIISGFAQVGLAIPHFLVGLLLVVIFAVKLHWLPANGYVAFTQDPGQWASHMVLPVISLAVVESAVLTRYVRSAFIDVLNEDYFRTSRAVGWRYLAAVIRHGLRNASLKVITIIGLELSALFIGGIVVENVFMLPGLGQQLLTNVSQRDLPVVQAIVMIFVAIVLVINTLVDLLRRLLDPRLRGLDDGRDA